MIRIYGVKGQHVSGQGNLQEAAKFLGGDKRTDFFGYALAIKITQLRLQRNLGEAVRLLQARQVQSHFHSEIDKGSDQGWLAFTQRLAGDIAGAKVTGEQARNTSSSCQGSTRQRSICGMALSKLRRYWE